MRRYTLGSPGEVAAALARQPFTYLVARHPYQRLVSAFLDFTTRLANKHRPMVKVAMAGFPAFLRAAVLGGDTSCSDSWCVSPNNPHWRPIEAFCLPCAINYTVISSMETFEEDFTRIAARLGVEVAVRAEHVHGGAGIEQLTREHLEGLPQEVRAGLEERYEHDLQMFGNIRDIHNVFL